MKQRLVILLVLIVFATFTNHPIIAQQSSSRQDEVLKVIENYDKAWNQKDVRSLEQILAPNYVYFSSDGQVRSRQYMLDFLRSPGYVLNSAERGDLQAYRAADTVVVSSRWKGHGTYEGKEFRDDQRCGLVFTRDGQHWKLLSEHCTQIVSPK
jgi:ketosteroid isomerase-like protein